MRAAAEVLEGAVAVERDGLDAFVARPGPRSARPCSPGPGRGRSRSPRRPGRRGARTPRRRRCARASPPRSARRSSSVTLTSVGELEVVVEAVLDRRADRHLGPRVELLHRLGHHVGGVVADQLQRLGVAVGEDRDLGRRRAAAPRGRAARRRPGSPAPPWPGRGRSPRRRRRRSRPSGSSSGLPSGSLTVIFGRGLAGHATRRAPPSGTRYVPLGGSDASARRGPGGPGGRRSAGRGSGRRRARSLPRARRAARRGAAQAREGRLGAVAVGDDEAHARAAASPPASAVGRDADPAAAQLPGDVAARRVRRRAAASEARTRVEPAATSGRSPVSAGE